MAIDARLLDCASTPEIEENFNRTLALFDAEGGDMTELQGDVAALEGTVAALEGTVAALKVCAVSFDTDGGSTAPDTQYLLNRAIVVEPTPPTKAGNTFAGWYNGETAWNFADAVADAMTLIAHWTAEEVGG